MENRSRQPPDLQIPVLVAAITVVAAMLRFWRLDQLPPGLFHDEAFNGLDVLRVLAGWHPIYFPGNFGREPLYLYLVAASVAALGRTPGAIRVVSAVLGTLTVPAAYLAAHEMFNRRIGLLTATVTAFTLWHITLSRIGFRAISLPLIAALMIWQGALAWRTRRVRNWLLAGALLGLTCYTYLAARFIPVALALWGAYCIFCVSSRGAPHAARSTQHVALGLVVALVVSLPLGFYALNHWDEMLLRAGQVSVFSPQINGGHPWQLLARQAFDTATMFFWRGDANARHNVPGRAVFDPAMAAFFLIGLAICLRGLTGRNRGPFTFVLIWTGVMLLPSILAEGTPSFLRAVGALPVMFIIPAVGLDAAWTWLDAHWLRKSGAVVCGLSLLIALAATLLAYFGSYAASRELHQAFDAAPVEMAVEVNRWLGTGWQGQGLTARTGPAVAGHQVWIDERLWNFSIATPFLVTESLTQSAYLHFTPGPPASSDATAIKLIVQPVDYTSTLTLLPRGWRIRAQPGAMVGGVPGQEPFLLYISFEAEPVQAVTKLAQFGAGIELVAQEARMIAPGKLVLRTEWRATKDIAEDLALYAQVVRDEQPVAQQDGPPAHGLLPTSLWRTGDVIVDERELTGSFLPARDQVRIGLYRFTTLQRLPVWDAAGHPLPTDYWILAEIQ